MTSLGPGQTAAYDQIAAQSTASINKTVAHLRAELASKDEAVVCFELMTDLYRHVAGEGEGALVGIFAAALIRLAKQPEVTS